MNYQRFLAELPADMQEPMARLLEAFQEEMRSQLAASQEEGQGLRAFLVNLEMTIAKLTESHHVLTQTIASLAENERSLTHSIAGLVESGQSMTRIVAQLVESMRGLEQMVDRLVTNQHDLEQTITGLTANLRSLTQSVIRLTGSEQGLIQTVVRLAEEQQTLAKAAKELVVAQGRTNESLQKLTARVERLESNLRTLLDEHLERKYRERILFYLSAILHPVQVLSPQDILPHLEAHLSQEEIERLLSLDLFLRGQVRHLAAKPEVWLAMEVASRIEDGDVNRAVEGARLLAKAGLPAIATVGGEDLGESAARLASQAHVLVVLKDRRLHWQEALAMVVKTG